jgi:hypothetical protein
MKFKVSNGGIPSGSYNATFQGLDRYEENVDKFGEGLLLKFEVSSGEHKGATATRIVSKKFSPKTNLFKFAKALAGRDLLAGDEFDFADVIGVRGMVIIEETEGGSTRVATFLRAPE